VKRIMREFSEHFFAGTRVKLPNTAEDLSSRASTAAVDPSASRVRTFSNFFDDLLHDTPLPSMSSNQELTEPKSADGEDFDFAAAGAKFGDLDSDSDEASVPDNNNNTPSATSLYSRIAATNVSARTSAPSVPSITGPFAALVIDQSPYIVQTPPQSSPSIIPTHGKHVLGAEQGQVEDGSVNDVGTSNEKYTQPPGADSLPSHEDLQPQESSKSTSGSKKKAGKGGSRKAAAGKAVVMPINPVQNHETGGPRRSTRNTK